MFCEQKKLGFYEKEICSESNPFFWNDNFNEEYINDERQEKWKESREKYGFDPREVWSLHDTVACFIYPRLRYFKDINVGYPSCMTNEEWLEILDKMIWTFEQHVTGDYYGIHENEDEYWKRYMKGLKMFKKYFTNLWC